MRNAEGGNATVTVCHTGRATPRRLHAARPTSWWWPRAAPTRSPATLVKPGAAVIDVGVNRIPDATKKYGFRLAASWIRLRKRGRRAHHARSRRCRPMTITMLLHNT
jgi:methylenetetrahydrofolate dehydrogenase (NADP+)/methenyltetrahydrofolate cyclohydrolase